MEQSIDPTLELLERRRSDPSASIFSPSASPTQSNRLSNRIRDSIFINKKRGSKSDAEDEDYDAEAEAQLKRNTMYNRQSTTVRFSDLPPKEFYGAAKINPAFEDDDNFNDDIQPNERKSFLQFQQPTYDDANIKNDQTYWDSFKSIPKKDTEDSSLSSNWVKFFLKLLKLLSHLITFIMVIVFGVCSKLLLHLMANMTRVNKTLKICNRDLNDDRLDPIKPYYSVLELKSDERIAWIWTLYFVLIAPDLFLFIRSVHTCLFKMYESPNGYYSLMIFFTSSAEVIGMSMFVYWVLPSLDVVVGLLVTNSFFLVPSICHWLRSSINSSGKFMHFAYIVALLLQILVIIAWPILITRKDQQISKRHVDALLIEPRDDLHLIWAIPLSAILISLGYWENFIGIHKPNEQEKNRFVKFLHDMKQSSIISKYAIYLWVSIWKCVLYFLAMLLMQALLGTSVDDRSTWDTMSDMTSALFNQFITAFSDHPIRLISKGNYDDSIHHSFTSNGSLPIIIGLLQIMSAFLCYQTINFVCKICIQPFGFALPISLVMPLCVSLADLIGQIPRMNENECWYADSSSVFQYLFFNVHYSLFDRIELTEYLFYAVWLAGFLSQIIITGHIWISNKERLSSTSQMFMLPLYTTCFVDQSLMLNRRLEFEEDGSLKKNRKTSTPNDNTDNDIRIYACATVWHETEDELLQMLKSIMRMDHDHCCRSMAVNCWNVDKRKVDYYEFETHLFVDDAFKKGKFYSIEAMDIDINEYVETLIQVLDMAAQNVHQRFIKISPPSIYITPYGGRLEWILPGGTKLIAHLKDKDKIRHRKRWSQVMYMYYLLGYRIFQKQYDKRQSLVKNTFILALDGDINFQPDAVMLLVDLMKKDDKLGAACGRVHPVGSGLMAWYQKFEYAISHWLQKATEHVFGCVLCSPGCFSLFRAEALCDMNVMNTYTTKPTEPIHFVQYDQGEDRWLCTLLLQKGWKIEYSAASDSFTHCPEGFDEFYIQRRRWTPSTMANIIDLLKSYKYTVRENSDISSLYMLYQASLMLGTILSPGTIFLMLVGATNTSFGLRNEVSFFLNFIPIAIFILVCFKCKTNMQILVAQFFSTFYAMLMLAVLVSTGIQIYNESIFAPSVTFFVTMLAMFIVSAVIHPQEILCLLPMFIYLLAIPSMYLLLTLYSIINLNIVTWGTRENTSANQPKPQQVQQKKDDNFLTDIRDYITNNAPDGSKWNVSCLCCTRSRNQDEVVMLKHIEESMSKLASGVDYMKKQQYQYKANFLRRRATFHSPNETESLLLADQNEEDIGLPDDEQMDVDNNKNDQQQEILESINVSRLRKPRWIHNENIKNGKIYSIENEEENFWHKFIEKYLKPLDKDEKREEDMAKNLIQLRNRAFFAMAIINLIFVLFVYLLQMHKDIFSFELLLSRTQNGTETELKMVDGEMREVPVYIERKIQMDPIGLILIIFFGLIMFIQFIGMLLHRMGTFTHLLAFTDLNFFKIDVSNVKNVTKQFDEGALEIVRFLMDWRDPKQSDEYVDFNMRNHFYNAFQELVDPDKACEFFKKFSIHNTVPNVSKKVVGAELSRRHSTFILRNSNLPSFESMANRNFSLGNLTPFKTDGNFFFNDVNELINENDESVTDDSSNNDNQEPRTSDEPTAGTSTSDHVDINIQDLSQNILRNVLRRTSFSNGSESVCNNNGKNQVDEDKDKFSEIPHFIESESFSTNSDDTICNTYL